MLAKHEQCLGFCWFPKAQSCTEGREETKHFMLKDEATWRDLFLQVYGDTKSRENTEKLIASQGVSHFIIP